MGWWSKTDLRTMPTYRVLAAAAGLSALAVFVCWQWVRGLSDQARSGQWPTATATIVANETNLSSRFRTPKVTYAYSVAGRDYRSSQLEMSRVSWTLLIRSDAAKCPVGSTLVVAYDPDDPSIATVRTGLAARDFLVAPVFLVCVGTGAALTIRELARRGTRASEAEATGS